MTHLPDGPVALIGLMASGKTSVGRALAERLARRFVDTDERIVERTGQTVKELWEAGGEAAYRPLERDVTLEALRLDPAVVVGVPGGAVLDEAVHSALTDPDLGAFVVFLRALPETLAGRVRPDDHRPLLQPDPLAAFTTMAADRHDRYEALADLIVDVDGRTVEAIAETVLESVTSRRWFIDANNVMGAGADRWWNDPPAAARRLVQRVAEWCRTHDDQVTMVFDGDPDPNLTELGGGNLAVGFATRKGRDAADDRIVELVEAGPGGPGSVRVVTSDKGLVERLPDTVDVVGAGAFRTRLGMRTGGR